MLTETLQDYDYYLMFGKKEDEPIWIAHKIGNRLSYGVGQFFKSQNVLKDAIEKGIIEKLYLLRMINIKTEYSEPNMLKSVRKGNEYKYKSIKENYCFLFANRKEKDHLKEPADTIGRLMSHYKDEIFVSNIEFGKKIELSDTRLPEEIKELEKFKDNLYATITVYSSDDFNISLIFNKNSLCWRMLIRNEDVVNMLDVVNAKKYFKIFRKNSSVYILSCVSPKDTIRSVVEKGNNFISHYKELYENYTQKVNSKNKSVTKNNRF